MNKLKIITLYNSYLSENNKKTIYNLNDPWINVSLIPILFLDKNGKFKSEKDISNFFRTKNE